MDRKEALERVIRAARRDLTGAGGGVRSIPAGKDRQLLEEAIGELEVELFNEPNKPTN